jgi:hypothetical protein
MGVSHIKIHDSGNVISPGYSLMTSIFMHVMLAILSSPIL